MSITLMSFVLQCFDSTLPAVRVHTESFLPRLYHRSATMDIFQSPHYRINKHLLFYLGQWPLQTQKERRFYRTTTILLIGSILVPKLIRFIECLGDPSSMVQCLPVLTLHVRCAANFLNCIINAKQMRQLTNVILEDWNKIGANLHQDILTRYADRGRLLTIAYAVCIFSALVMYLSLPAVPAVLDAVVPLNHSRNRIYLYEREYFVDKDENYVVLLFHAYFTMPFVLGMIVAYDTMFAVYVQHTCGIYATLGARLENVTADRVDNNILKINGSSVGGRDETYENIVACIKIHKEADACAALIESWCCINYLIVLGINVLAITFTGFMMVTHLDKPAEASSFATFTFGLIIGLFYPCWQGDMLMDHSQNILTNAYNVDWYSASPRAKKLLIMIMKRSTEPCKVTAGKIFVLSMESFSTALKTSLSYFTVLLSMQ